MGRYDGKHPCLTAGTTAGKVLIHCPQNRASNPENEVLFLNINRKITSVEAGALNPALNRDVLMVGTQTSLMVYDVEENSDLFYKEVHDGVNVIAFGPIKGIEKRACVVGGNCSVQAFDHEGSELFWSVTGDNVSALAFCDVNEDGIEELVCGTEDFEIRIFAGEQVLKEITETDVIMKLVPVYKNRFAYALGGAGTVGGTVGIYEKFSRAWRTKSKSRINCITSFDLDNDGVPELICGWDNGKVEVRNQKTGEVMSKDYFQAPVAALVHADYRLDGRDTLMCLTVEGDVRGWLPADPRVAGSTAAAGDTKGQMEKDKASEVYRALLAKKKELTQELNSFQEQLRQISAAKEGTGGKKDSTQGVIPTDTKLQASLKCNQTAGTVELHLTTNNFSVIRMVIIFAEHLFDGEACTLHPMPPSNNVIVQIAPLKDVSTSLNIKAFTGQSANSTQYHVFELRHAMPKFSMYLLADGPAPSEPKGFVEFNLPTRPIALWSWLRSSFIGVSEEMPQPPSPEVALEVRFVSLRSKESLIISMTMVNGGTLRIRVDDMEVAGEIVQDLCNNIRVTELESVAHFRREMEKFKAVLGQVDEYNAVRLKLTAEMADGANLVKALIVQAEDYRMLSDMASLKKVFAGLHKTNGELIGEYNKRATNHQQLLSQLKEVNLMIQKASNLRVGSAKTRVVAACRAAIKKNNIHELFQIITKGTDGGAA